MSLFSFAQNSLPLGLDFGSTEVKIVKLERSNPLKVVAAGSVRLTADIMTSDVASDMELVAQSTRKLLNDLKIKDSSVYVALPESQIFTRVIEMPSLSAQELFSALKWQAEQYIPLPLSEVRMDFAILSKSADQHEKMNVLLVAAPLTVINRVVKIVEMSNLVPKAIESDLIAVHRCFASLLKSSTILLIDAGGMTTDIAVMGKYGISISRSITIGSETISRAIAEQFKFSLQQAQEYKQAYGLREDQLEGKLRMIIAPLIDRIVEEVRKTTDYYVKKYGENTIQSAILHGGGAQLPGLVTYLAEALGIEVQIGNPWNDMDSSDPTISSQRAASPKYTVATGLALRDLA